MALLLSKLASEKLSAAAWERALREKRITPEDAARIHPSIPKILSSAGDEREYYQRGVRQALSEYAPELTGRSLTQHRELQRRRFPIVAKRENVSTDTLFGAPVAFSAPEGTMVSKGMAAQLREGLGANVAPASDPSSLMATLQHELAERRHMEGMAHGIPLTPVASHAGTAPILAERLATRDPDTHKLFHQIRNLPEDAAVGKLLKRFGATGNYTPPLGGRAHRTLERAVANAFPALKTEIGQRMLSVGFPVRRYSASAPALAAPAATKFLAHFAK